MQSHWTFQTKSQQQSSQLFYPGTELNDVKEGRRKAEGERQSEVQREKENKRKSAKARETFDRCQWGKGMCESLSSCKL